MSAHAQLGPASLVLFDVSALHFETDAGDGLHELHRRRYHRLWRIEKALGMYKNDLAARPIYHRTRESIDAHLSIVFAAMAISNHVGAETGWSIEDFVRTTLRYRTITIAAGNQKLTATDTIPDDLATALAKIRSDSAH